MSATLVGAVSDDHIVVFALPFPLLHQLQLRRRQIWGLVLTFSLGAVTIAMSVLRFATVEVIHAWTNVCMWIYPKDLTRP